MREILKIIWFRFFGIVAPLFIRPFYAASRPVSRKMRFIGRFPLTTNKGNKFYLFNNAFALETNIFWMGLENYNWENFTRLIWTELCKSSKTIFDIGANTGIFAVLAKANNPSSVVVAFEPQPNIFYVLKKNNEVNHFDIRCENIALSDKAGTLPFYNSGEAAFTTENSTSGSLNQEWRPDNQRSIMVSVTEMKEYIEKHAIGNIDLIKIDVETFEYEVLVGYGKYLKSHSPVFILEIQDRTIGKKIESIIDKSNYHYYNIDEGKGLIKVDELGLSQDHNYLLCPESKKHLVEKYIVSK